MQTQAPTSLKFDPYRTLNWNLNLWFSQAEAADSEEKSSARQHTAALLCGLTCAYLNLLGEEFERLTPTHEHYFENGSSRSTVAGYVVVATLIPGEIAASTVTVTWPAATESARTIEELITGHALRATVMGGLIWRPCITKLAEAYNSLIDDELIRPSAAINLRK